MAQTPRNCCRSQTRKILRCLARYRAACFLTTLHVVRYRAACCLAAPSSEYGTNKTVGAVFWPRLSGKVLAISSRCSLFTRKRSAHGWPYRWGLAAHASRDHTLVGPLWEGYHESRRCSRDTYPESYITKHTSIRRILGHRGGRGRASRRARPGYVACWP